MEQKIYKMAARAVMAVLRGQGLHGSEMAELLHLLKHVFHEVKETVKDALEPHDEQHERRR